MNILLINGSPKGDKSNSLRLAHSFIDGIKDNTFVETKELSVSKMKINGCKGCFCCWNKTPGKCIHQDDMQEVIDGQLWADVIIWSFPLYYFNVPGSLKNLIDRQLPMSLPFMVEREDNVGSGSHPARYDMSNKRHVLISTCGFYSSKGNYDSVLSMFDHFCGKNNYETIFCGQGELFRVPELKERTDEYLGYVKKAGFEFAKGSILESTRKSLSELLFEKEVFEQMADASWGIDQETGQKSDEHLMFTKQMAALYNKKSYDGKDRVLEMCYSDFNKTYQILLSKDGSKVYTDGSLTYTTRIDTPWDIWKSISLGEMRGDEALVKGLYSVSGDLELMMHWSHYFGGTSSQEEESENKQDRKKPSMTTMLIAWIVFWMAVSIHVSIGSIVSLVVCASLPMIMFKNELILFDKLTFLLVGILSAFAALTGYKNIAIVAGYLCFGLIWLFSCFTKEPLCAAYVKYDFSGDESLKNPIFMKTNYIIAYGWGILYVCISLWSWFLLNANQTLILQIINNGATILMGIFTAWFQNWYPRHIMISKK